MGRIGGIGEGLGGKAVYGNQQSAIKLVPNGQREGSAKMLETSRPQSHVQIGDDFSWVFITANPVLPARNIAAVAVTGHNDFFREPDGGGRCC